MSLSSAVLAFGCAIDTGQHDDPGTGGLGGNRPGSSTGNTTSSTQNNGGGADDQGRPGNGKKRNQAVAFIHGTSDHGDLADLKCGGTGDDWHCVSPTAVAEYWTQPNIDSERKRADGSKRPYVVIGCPLSAQTPWPNPAPVKPKNGPPEPGSAVCVAAEIATFLNGPDGVAGNADDIEDIVLVTHSGGSNVVRYILQQHTAKPTFDRVHKASRGFIGIAAPSHGTYLADRVFRFSGLAISNKLLNAGYDDDGVEFIQTDKMAAWNKDPAKLANLDKDVAGVPSYMASGSFPDKDGDEAKIECGGGTETKGLNVLHRLYLDAADPETFRDGCSDGFITCLSAMALANNDESRVVFGQLGTKEIGKTHFRAHNQSRRDCDGLDVDIRNKINQILDAPAPLPKSGGGGGGADDGKKLLAYLPPSSVLTLADAHFDRLGLAMADAAIAKKPNAVVRVKIDTPTIEMRAFLRGPAGDSFAASFERGSDGHTYAVAKLPSNAEPGSWILHVGANAEEVEAHRESRVPVWVSSASGSIVRDAITVARQDEEVNVLVTAKTTGTSRLGARATLVFEEASTGKTWNLGTEQASADAKVGAETTTTLALRFHVPKQFVAGVRPGKLAVRDVALVSHDDAATLDAFDVAR